MPSLKPVRVPKLKRLMDVLRYLVNELAKSHKGKVRLTNLVAFGALYALDQLETANAALQASFAKLVGEERDKVTLDRLLIGGRPLSYGTWYIATFPRGHVLAPHEEAEYLARVLSVLPEGTVGLVCRHEKLHTGTIDYNFLVTPTVAQGLTAVARRQAEHCELSRLQKASDLAVEVLNKRRPTHERRIPTIEIVQTREREQKGRLSLEEELAQIPDLEQLAHDLSSLLPRAVAPAQKANEPTKVAAVLENLELPPQGSLVAEGSKLVEFEPASGWAWILRPGVKEPQRFFLPQIVSQAILRQRERMKVDPRLSSTTQEPPLGSMVVMSQKPAAGQQSQTNPEIPKRPTQRGTHVMVAVGATDPAKPKLSPRTRPVVATQPGSPAARPVQEGASRIARLPQPILPAEAIAAHVTGRDLTREPAENRSRPGPIRHPRTSQRPSLTGSTNSAQGTTSAQASSQSSPPRQVPERNNPTHPARVAPCAQEGVSKEPTHETPACSTHGAGNNLLNGRTAEVRPATDSIAQELPNHDSASEFPHPAHSSGSENLRKPSKASGEPKPPQAPAKTQPVIQPPVPFRAKPKLRRKPQDEEGEGMSPIASAVPAVLGRTEDPAGLDGLKHPEGSILEQADLPQEGPPIETLTHKDLTPEEGLSR